MSDTNNTPPEGAAGDAASAQAATNDAQAEHKGFEDVRKKISDQLAELGHHVDGLSAKLTDAAGQARQVIERELSNLKTQHPEAFAKLDELRHSGDESLDVLRNRLDKLAGDLEKAVSGFLTSIADQAKKATKSHAESNADGAAPAAAPPAEAPAEATPDKSQS